MIFLGRTEVLVGAEEERSLRRLYETRNRRYYRLDTAPLGWVRNARRDRPFSTTLGYRFGAGSAVYGGGTFFDYKRLESVTHPTGPTVGSADFHMPADIGNI